VKVNGVERLEEVNKEGGGLREVGAEVLEGVDVIGGTLVPLKASLVWGDDVDVVLGVVVEELFDAVACCVGSILDDGVGEGDWTEGGG
jgi:hypothetical protein